ncbi:hypothetical protein C8J57DRAFT_1228557 [Mycena rebaudengoi]|nr:hypothetical protein C8J57DRAFT_1228557 [Mycena rebaudengoi]
MLSFVAKRRYRARARAKRGPSELRVLLKIILVCDSLLAAIPPVIQAGRSEFKSPCPHKAILGYCRYREYPEGHFTEMGGDEGLSNFIMETPNLHYGMPGGPSYTNRQWLQNVD